VLSQAVFALLSDVKTTAAAPLLIFDAFPALLFHLFLLVVV